MSSLKIQIDERTGVALVSGDTFRAKDVIKTLGRARWDSQRLLWRVESLTCSFDEVSSHFAGFQVTLERSGESGVSDREPVAAPPTPGVLRDGNLPASVSVAELAASIQRVLQQSFPRILYLRAVVVSVKRAHEGRLFFELADPDDAKARVQAVVWKGGERLFEKLRQSGFELEPDLPLLLGVEVGLNPRGASISLTIQQVIAEYTVAKLAARREQTNQRLKSEGLFDRNRAQKLPFLPRRLVLLTSATGTVINDFRSALDVAEFRFELLWIHIAVQGERTRSSVLSALQRVKILPDIDAVLIFRGGGSKGELSAFDDYDIAKAVAEFPIPVLSAIGHEEDQTSVQDVSWRCFGVPKDLGRFFSDRVLELRQRFRQVVDDVHRVACRCLEEREERLRAVGQLLPERAGLFVRTRAHQLEVKGIEVRTKGEILLERATTNLDRVSMVLPERGQRVWSFGAEHLIRNGERIRLLIERCIAIWAERLVTFELQFQEASPRTQLRRGFTLVRRSGTSAEQLVLSSAELHNGEKIIIEFADGETNARVEKENE